MRSAERIAFHLLKQKPEEAMRLADAIRDVKTRIKHCSVCYNLTEQDPCPVCSSKDRDRQVLCVVEEPLDVVALEKTHEYNGLYHVLHGHIDPINGIMADDLLAGVAAGRAGDFGHVVGVDRVGHADALREHGADTVVTDLAELLDRGTS